MVYIFYFIINTLLPVNECYNIKKGIFKIEDDYAGNTIIKRNDSVQLERNEKLGTLLLQKIRWQNKCSHIIYDMKVIKGNNNLDFEGKKYFVEYKHSQNKIFDVTIRIEPDDFTLNTKVEKIGDELDSDFYDFVKKHWW